MTNRVNKWISYSLTNHRIGLLIEFRFVDMEKGTTCVTQVCGFVWEIVEEVPNNKVLGLLKIILLKENTIGVILSLRTDHF